MNYPPEVTNLGNTITNLEGINNIISSKGGWIGDRYIVSADYKNGDPIPDEILNDLDSDYVYDLILLHG